MCVSVCVFVCVKEREREREREREGEGFKKNFNKRRDDGEILSLKKKKDFPIMRNPVCARLCVLIACDRSDMWTIPAQ